MLPRVLVIAALFVPTGTLGGDHFAYEADSFPQDAGWQIEQIVCGPQLWVDGGWFHQHVALCPGYDPPGGQFSAYRRSLSEFVGAPDFFIEWRVHCDAPNGDLFPWGGGASLGTAGHGTVVYNCYIVRDEVWLLRDTELPYVFVNIDPATPHTYRLELRGAQSYTWLIDGQVVGTGTPEGAYPADNPRLVWMARAAWGPNTTRWDFIRYGRIPQLTPGDVNCDDAINFLDIDPFLLALFDADAYGRAHPGCLIASADLDVDDLVNFFDIDPFVACLFGTCP